MQQVNFSKNDQFEPLKKFDISKYHAKYMCLVCVGCQKVFLVKAWYVQ